MGFSCLVQKIAGKCSCKQSYIEGPSQSDGTCQNFRCWHKFLLVTGLLLLAFVIGSFVLYSRNTQTLSIWQSSNEIQEHLSVESNDIQNNVSFAMAPASVLTEEAISSPLQQPAPSTMQELAPSTMQEPAPSTMQRTDSKEIKGKYEEQCFDRSGALPKAVVQETSDLEMRSLWGDPMEEDKRKIPQNLLAISVGIKQKENVKKMLEKFCPENFTVMLFHYDGVIDKWSDLKWSERAIHVAAINQTKWWFAKRFLHPDIVAIYNYIFLWDEDLGVENFNADRYLTIMEEEGLEISQPALDRSKSEVHHEITARIKRSRVHRRMYKNRGGHLCFENSTGPPCTGWVEMMAPVFSRAAWRCTWGMIQNDLIHGWGIDMKLGYCVQGDRSKNVGVIDSEYIVHQAIPSLGNNDGGTVLQHQVGRLVLFWVSPEVLQFLGGLVADSSQVAELVAGSCLLLQRVLRRRGQPSLLFLLVVRTMTIKGGY
ncbi:uncharacterized protein LOC131051852 isoform X2 [Cryptomeria japonica]|uniref:uncharacterized protein LOC131051852 isoform X2 n=1 Tax=Cryptomeria japonica TaxID=3369 RepID=UPI0025AB898D|nr:uncharacterized protein LOC131051852 isoform X2 [Cryptomeria japonica]